MSIEYWNQIANKTLLTLHVMQYHIKGKEESFIHKANQV